MRQAIKTLGYYKTKLYSKNVISLPSAVKRFLGLEEGDEIVFEVSPEGVILRNPKSIEVKEIEPLSEEELKKARQEAWIFRQAYDRAEEFLKSVGEALRDIHGEYKLIRGKNSVSLLFNTLRIEYVETHSHPNGVLYVEQADGKKVIKENPSFSVGEATLIGCLAAL